MDVDSKFDNIILFSVAHQKSHRYVNRQNINQSFILTSTIVHCFFKLVADYSYTEHKIELDKYKYTYNPLY